MLQTAQCEAHTFDDVEVAVVDWLTEEVLEGFRESEYYEPSQEACALRNTLIPLYNVVKSCVIRARVLCLLRTLCANEAGPVIPFDPFTFRTLL